MATCTQCGTTLADNAGFCSQCGAVRNPGPLAAAGGDTRIPAGPPDNAPRAGEPRAGEPPDNAPRAGEPRAGEPRAGAKTQMGFMVSPDFLAPPGNVSVPGLPPVAPSPAAASGPAVAPFARGGAKTMIGGVTEPSPPPTAPPTGRPAGTMIGISVASFLPASVASSPAVGAPGRPPPQGQPKDPGQPRAENRTMLGVAIPGIAPTHGGLPAVPPHGAPGAPAPGARDHQTMLGVAMPGIAPIHPSMGGASSGMPQAARDGSAMPQAGGGGALPPRAKPIAALPLIVPAPAPLSLDAMPRAPVILVKKGFPLAAVAGGIGALVLLAGAAVFLLYKGGTPLLVTPRLGPQGNEQLHLVCESCKDGTVASLDGARATFTNKEADLDLKTPLKVGDNPIAIDIDRPGSGRDESVRAVVPVGFRVRADLADVASDPPLIAVRVEALPGTDVRVDGKPVALDLHGAGAYTFDISNETDGPSDEGRVIEKTIPYEVVPKNGKPERGTVAARVGVIPLRVDAPTSHAVTESARFWVSGRTSKGGIVTVNGKPVAVAVNGSFGEVIEAPRLGDTPVVVRSTAPQVAPRTVHLNVRRVEHLEPEAKAFEAAHALGYDAVIGNIAANAGQQLVVEGDVLESRGQNHQTVIIVNDRRGCAKGPCVARVVHGEDAAFKPGETIRAFGRVTRPVSTSDGKSVPEIEADFVVRGKTR